MSPPWDGRLGMAIDQAHPYRRVGAKGPEAGFRVWRADHGERAAAVLFREGRRLFDVESARRDISAIAEPETDMEGAGRRQADGGIETEELIEKNGADVRSDNAFFVGFEI